MFASYLSGLLLGFALIMPIGAQNVFVVGQGLAAGWPRAAWSAATAGACDSLLIIVGVLGVSGLLRAVPGLREALLLFGALFLLYLAIQSWRSSGKAILVAEGERLSVRSMVSRTTTVSLLNPHAILDTVGVIGATVASKAPDVRFPFAAGTVTASWAWFFALAITAAFARRYLTPRGALWFERISGTILFVFAVILAVEFTRSVVR